MATSFQRWPQLSGSTALVIGLRIKYLTDRKPYCMCGKQHTISWQIENLRSVSRIMGEEPRRKVAKGTANPYRSSFQWII